MRRRSQRDSDLVLNIAQTCAKWASKSLDRMEEAEGRACSSVYLSLIQCFTVARHILFIGFPPRHSNGYFDSVDAYTADRSTTNCVADTKHEKLAYSFPLLDAFPLGSILLFQAYVFKRRPVCLKLSLTFQVKVLDPYCTQLRIRCFPRRRDPVEQYFPQARLLGQIQNSTSRFNCNNFNFRTIGLLAPELALQLFLVTRFKLYSFRAGVLR